MDGGEKRIKSINTHTRARAKYVSLVYAFDVDEAALIVRDVFFYRRGTSEFPVRSPVSEGSGYSDDVRVTRHNCRNDQKLSGIREKR